jgi:serine phosphatase RsbU (regulator of sigma subunit)
VTPITSEPKTRWTTVRPYVFASTALAILVVLWALSRENYLLFHTLSEMFAISVAFSVFIIAYNTRSFLRNNYLLIVGMALLFVGVIDLFHALAYKGMNVFRPDDPDLATQLWLCARYLQMAALLVAPLFLSRRPLKVRFLLPIFAVLTALLLLAAFAWDIMPTALDDNGLTQFKVGSEYVICAGLGVALALLISRRRYFEPKVTVMLSGYIVLTILSELAFTLYTEPDGPANLTGHILRILAVYLAYRAIVQTGLVQPYSLLFRELKQSEERHIAGEEQARHIANALQEALLSVPDYLPGLEFAHLYQSATQATRVGGDFYDLFELDGDRVGILVGDVSGKGLPAATLTSRVKDTIRAYSMNGTPPSEVLAQANALLLRSTDTTSWVSLFLGFLHTPTGRLVYSSAGHPPAAVKRASKDPGAAVGAFYLQTTSPILGAFEEATFMDSRVLLEPEDVLVLYTDGVIEARRDGELYGEDRLLAALDDYRGGGAGDMPAAIFEQVKEFTGGRLPDDVAIVALSRRPLDKLRQSDTSAARPRPKDLDHPVESTSWIGSVS